MVYKVKELVALEAWAKAGGDAVWKFHMGSWISFAPVSVLRTHERMCCLGGHLALVRGAKPVWQDFRGMIGMHAVEVQYQGGLVDIPAFGAEVLGITDAEAEALFSPSDEDFSDPGEVALRFLETLVNRARQGFPNFDDEDVEEFLLENKDINLGYEDDSDYYRD